MDIRVVNRHLRHRYGRTWHTASPILPNTSDRLAAHNVHSCIARELGRRTTITAQ
jgi:hypothetical protein